MENRGQLADPSVLFYTDTRPVSAAFTRMGVTFTLREKTGIDDGLGATTPNGASNPVSFSLNLPGCGLTIPTGVGDNGYPTNFYIGREPAGWTEGILTFSEVIYPGVIPGVDVRFHFADTRLKYDFVVQPWADTESIEMAYDGISGLRLDAGTGDLLIDVAGSELRDSKPMVMQEDGSSERAVPASFQLMGALSYGFTIPEGICLTKPFIIDPGLLHCTYLGGGGLEDTLYGITLNSKGEICVVGATTSRDYPVTHTLPYHPVMEHIVLTVLDPGCEHIRFSTVIGGSSTQGGYGIVTMPNGDYVVAGTTDSKDFPVTGNALNRTAPGGGDSVLFRVAPNGTLVYSSYVGGRGLDSFILLDVDGGGNVYIGGYTLSTDLWCSPGAFCSALSPKPGTFATFLQKYDPTLTKVLFSSYVIQVVGSNLHTRVRPYTMMRVDTDASVLMSGRTDLRGAPAGTNGYSSSNAGGNDGFVLRMSPDGDKLLAFTFLGGSADEEVLSIAISSDGRVLATGYTNSTDFPADSAGRETALTKCFIAAFDASLTHLMMCEYIGGTVEDYGIAMAASPTGEMAYVVGRTYSPDVPCTSGCFDTYVVRQAPNLFLVGLNLSTHAVEYCSIIGVGGIDYDNILSNNNTWLRATGMTIDSNDHLYFAGLTTATNFTTTPTALYPSYRGGSSDGFVMVLDPRPCGVRGPPSGLRAVDEEDRVQLDWDRPSNEGARVLKHRMYRGEEPDALEVLKDVDGRFNGTNDTTAVPGRTYYYAMTAINSAGEGYRSATVSAMAVGRPSAPTDLTAVNENGSVRLGWGPPETDGGLRVLYYDVLRAEGTGTPHPYHPTVELGFVDRSVGIGINYTYEVVAVNALGVGTPATISIMVVPTPPTPPQAIVLTAGDGEINVRWLPPASDGGIPVVGYRVYIGSSPDTLAPKDLPATRTDYTDRELRNGDRYYYRVTAVNGFFEGPPTETMSEVPFGRPSEPRELLASRGDRAVVLSWTPPADLNGRDVRGYVVYRGQSTASLFPIARPINAVFPDTGLENGVMYFYEVSAFNEAGESFLRTATVNAVPMGPPGSPIALTAVQEGMAIALGWTAPTDLGGASRVTYRLDRSQDGGAYVTIAEISDELAYLDTDVTVGSSYVYRLYAVNEAAVGLPADAQHKVVVEPGTVSALVAKSGVGCVNLIWSQPADDGGSPIVAYNIMRGTSPSDLKYVNWTDALAFMDIEVKTGLTYYYAVQASNVRRTGPLSDTVHVVPWDLPLAPEDLKASHRDGEVRLTWSPSPWTGSQAAVLAYRLERRTAMDDTVFTVLVGTNLTYTDTDLDGDVTYYYSVVPTSEIGDGRASTTVTVGPSEPARGVGLVAIAVTALVALLVVLAATAFIVRRRSMAAAAAAAAQAAGGTGAPPTPPGPTHIVEEVFVVYRDGRLMARCSREECRTEDADLMSGMLIAVQGIIQDGLQRGGELESIKYGENLIMMASGPYVNLAAVVYGEPDAGLRERLLEAVERVETSYAGVIEEWTGDLTQVSGIEGIVASLVQGTAPLTRSDVKAVKAVQSVSVLSAIDFYRGYVRLKVAAVNATEGLIAEVAMEVTYDADMLRLERVEPVTLEVRGDRVSMGNVKPGERKTVAFFFDPQICQGTHIDGLLTYVDAQGVRNRVEMKRRHADVVCPIFFTREHANTAMLRQLVKARLDKKDLRVFRYPRELSPEVVLTLGKAALGGTAVQLVREFIERGPPYYAEVWYYGETKVHAIQIVMRLGVVEESQAIEFFAASTAMEPITGLIAEFRRELVKVVGDRAAQEGGLLLERDEALEEQLAGRDLKLYALTDDGTGEGPSA